MGRGGIMKKKDLIRKIIEDNNGIVRVEDITNAGVTKPYFYDYVRENNLQKVSHGIYILPDTWEDPFYLLQLKCPQVVFSHESALYLLGLAEREPIYCPLTVTRNYSSKYLKDSGFKIYRVAENVLNLGVIEQKTTYGNIVRTYSKERTICDILRSKKNIEIQDFQTALKEYVKSADKDLTLLSEYAKIFHVDRLLKIYLEVLL